MSHCSRNSLNLEFIDNILLTIQYSFSNSQSFHFDQFILFAQIFQQRSFHLWFKPLSLFFDRFILFTLCESNAGLFTSLVLFNFSPSTSLLFFSSFQPTSRLHHGLLVKPLRARSFQLYVGVLIDALVSRLNSRMRRRMMLEMIAVNVRFFQSFQYCVSSFYEVL